MKERREPENRRDDQDTSQSSANAPQQQKAQDTPQEHLSDGSIDRRDFVTKVGGIGGLGLLSFGNLPGERKPRPRAADAKAMQDGIFPKCPPYAAFSDGADCNTGGSYTCVTSFKCDGGTWDDFECVGSFFCPTVFLCTFSFDAEDCEPESGFHCVWPAFACEGSDTYTAQPA